MRNFEDYYNGYESENGRKFRGYVELVEELSNYFPLSEPQILGEENQKKFINLFGAILRMRNLLVSFDEFQGKDLIPERDWQDYLGRYQDLGDAWKRQREDGEIADIADDVVFEVELIKQIEINIDYILTLVKTYYDDHCKDKEVLSGIVKAIDASPELRSKKQLIQAFIDSLNPDDDVAEEWRHYVIEQCNQDLDAIIKEENLNSKNTRKFIENSFRDGEVKTIGSGIDGLLPPISRFASSGNAREKKKQQVIDKLKVFFEKYFNTGALMSFMEQEAGESDEK
ncbi:hypothetical protein [Helicobacter sp. 12S02232-10]|uniref:type I restriction endonuclease subunit R, EcoR124 family n=1 Tax=Helicobacter sp. 12S02232-10 TaxID=1476197 RepID=UPI0031B9ED73